MKTAELKDVHYSYSDVLSKNNAYLCMLQDEVCFSVTLLIGEKGNSGADYFDVTIYNPTWIKKHKYLLGKFAIIVDTDDFDDVIEYLRIEIAQITGNDWDEISNKLKKMFSWEYDDYLPSKEEQKRIVREYIQNNPEILKEFL
ncbi:Imm8 family immunity protein [Bibersteinia trehalosi]|uniref:Imm8 family immunity protein n=1 Tax=Bibersteinia trehalosi TaxID=47735 RepID=UPI004045F45C